MSANVLHEIKDKVDSFVGREVKVKANRGRRKAMKKEGILEKTHPNVFVVKVEDSDQTRRLSYSYADLLTDNVELKSKTDETRIGTLQ
ncbi:MAG: Veg family protein [Bacillota bacterium]